MTSASGRPSGPPDPRDAAPCTRSGAQCAAPPVTRAAGARAPAARCRRAPSSPVARPPRRGRAVVCHRAPGDAGAAHRRRPERLPRGLAGRRRRRRARDSARPRARRPLVGRAACARRALRARRDRGRPDGLRRGRPRHPDGGQQRRRHRAPRRAGRRAGRGDRRGHRRHRPRGLARGLGPRGRMGVDARRRRRRLLDRPPRLATRCARTTAAARPPTAPRGAPRRGSARSRRSRGPSTTRPTPSRPSPRSPATSPTWPVGETRTPPRSSRRRASSWLAR